MSSSQELIRDSGTEMLAKRIIRINRENAHHSTVQAIATEKEYYEKAGSRIKGF